MRVLLVATSLSLLAKAAGKDRLSALYIETKKNKNTMYLGQYDRACRVDGNYGDFNSVKGVSRKDCQKKCNEDKECKGYEYMAYFDYCEHHKESGLPYLLENCGAFSEELEGGHECFWKAKEAADSYDSSDKKKVTEKITDKFTQNGWYFGEEVVGCEVDSSDDDKSKNNKKSDDSKSRRSLLRH